MSNAYMRCASDKRAAFNVRGAWRHGSSMCALLSVVDCVAMRVAHMRPTSCQIESLVMCRAVLLSTRLHLRFPHNAMAPMMSRGGLASRLHSYNSVEIVGGTPVTMQLVKRCFAGVCGDSPCSGARS